MKKVFIIISTTLFILTSSGRLLSQSMTVKPELGINAGTFFNIGGYKFSTSHTILAGYIAPYLRIKRHEFCAGAIYPFIFPVREYDDYVTERFGMTASYKFFYLSLLVMQIYFFNMSSDICIIQFNMMRLLTIILIVIIMFLVFSGVFLV